MFKNIKSVKDNQPKVRTLFHVFDHTVKPGLLYFIYFNYWAFSTLTNY